MKNPIYTLLNFLYTAVFHRRIIREMEAELMKPFEARIEDMIARQGAVNLTIESPIVRLWAGMFSSLLNSYPDARNYLSMTFEDDQRQLWQIMLQRIGAKTPVDIVVEKIAETNHLCEQLAALQAAQSEQNEQKN